MAGRNRLRAHHFGSLEGEVRPFTHFGTAVAAVERGLNRAIGPQGRNAIGYGGPAEGAVASLSADIEAGLVAAGVPTADAPSFVRRLVDPGKLRLELADMVEVVIGYDRAIVLDDNYSCDLVGFATQLRDRHGFRDFDRLLRDGLVSEAEVRPVLAKALLDRGIEVIAYRNQAEDNGGMSYCVVSDGQRGPRVEVVARRAMALLALKDGLFREGVTIDPHRPDRDAVEKAAAAFNASGEPLRIMEAWLAREFGGRLSLAATAGHGISDSRDYCERSVGVDFSEKASRALAVRMCERLAGLGAAALREFERVVDLKDGIGAPREEQPLALAQPTGLRAALGDAGALACRIAKGLASLRRAPADAPDTAPRRAPDPEEGPRGPAPS